MERVPKELKTVTISGGDMFNNAVIEKLVAIIDGHWRIWLHADRQLTQGTILRLYDDGRCEQVTLDEDGIESNFIKIKGPDSAS
jgi:hypothetical protein